MRTVRNLIGELNKFPDNFLCTCFDGCLVIAPPGGDGMEGMVLCEETDINNEPATEHTFEQHEWKRK